MGLYDQNQNGTGTPWYGQQPQTQTPLPSYYKSQTPVPTPQPNQLNQFIWINNPGVVDMWPLAAGSEMTFIDNEKMTLYVKRVDEYNHPLKTRKFKLVEITDEPNTDAQAQTPQVNLDELKNFISSEIDKSVSSKFQTMFTMSPKEGVTNV